MLEKEKVDSILQIINSMEDAVKKLKEAYGEKDVGSFENSKKAILEFQRKLSEELGQEKLARK